MSFWNWFSSESRIREALEKSKGYDISPIVIHPPANKNDPPKDNEKKLTLWTDYTYESENNAFDNVWTDTNRK